MGLYIGMQLALCPSLPILKIGSHVSRSRSQGVTIMNADAGEIEESGITPRNRVAYKVATTPRCPLA